VKGIRPFELLWHRASIAVFVSATECTESSRAARYLSDLPLLTVTGESPRAARESLRSSLTIEARSASPLAVAERHIRARTPAQHRTRADIPLSDREPVEGFHRTIIAAVT